MSEHSEAIATPMDRAATEAEVGMAKASERAAGFLFGVQKLMLEEFVFLGNEFLLWLWFQFVGAGLLSQISGCIQERPLHRAHPFCHLSGCASLRLGAHKLAAHGLHLRIEIVEIVEE